MKINDYVRNKYGIAKIIDIKNNNGIEILVFDKNICFLVNKETGEIKDDNLFNQLAIIEGVDINKIKSSPNIIDLIQEGDILKVNDFKDVYTIYEVEMFRNPYTNEKYLGIRNNIGKKPKRLYEIPLVNLSIVTKEQFSQMEYRINE